MDDLKRSLDEIAQDPGKGPRDNVLSKLREISDGLTDSFNGELKFSLVHDHRLTQFRFTVERQEIGWTDTLFRAHVPMEGFPVTLEMFADQPTKSCSTVDDLEKLVVGYLSEQAIMVQLGWLSRAA